MNRDAHYYAMLAFCRACGFTKQSAQIIAFASQYVDDARVNLIFFDNINNLTLEHDLVENRPAFFNMATCHTYFRVKTFNYEAMINNTVAFHFVPGCKGENFTKKLRCLEESPVILDILNDALHENNLIKLGIVLHPYADTFSHQGFSGLLSKVNDIKHCEPQTEAYLGLFDKLIHVFRQFGEDKYEEFFDRIVPAYGHGQALEFPDIPYMAWTYEYDYSGEFNGTYKMLAIDNRDRYKRAFYRIKQHLDRFLANYTHYIDSSFKFENIDMLIDTLLLEASAKQREENWVEFLIGHKFFEAHELDQILYDHNKWLKEAFRNFDPHVFDNRRVDGAQLADNFMHSCWHQFYLAVKWYKQKFFHYCSRHQLSIPH